MPRTKEIVIAQPLMERLSGHTDWPNTQAVSLRLLKESIRRDLEAMLNTRRPLARELEQSEQAAGSVLNYGLEDLGDLRSAPDGYLPEMQRAVQRCLAEYEPRLMDVTVSVREGNAAHREIRLHIKANLPLYPSVEAISFDTVFDLARETYSVG